MTLFTTYLITELITYPIILYIHFLILNKKINFNKINFYLGIILFTILNYYNFIYVDGFIRILTSSIILFVSSSIIFNENISKIFTVVVIQQFIFFISELIFALVALILNIKLDSFMNTTCGIIISNFIITYMSVGIILLPFVRKFFTWMIKTINSIIDIKKYILVLFFIVTINILLVSIYIDSSNKVIIFINLFFIIIYSFIIYQFLNEKSENVKYKEQNKMLLDNLNEYEKMLDYQRVSNHENKNQLLVIQGMINKENTKALEYIDEIIKEKREDDEGIYTSASIIPQGGLQGLIYQKMLKMKENNIIINLKVERKVRKINFDDLPSKTNYDLCRAVGIIIDNAIEENLNLKEREILICMYIEDEYLVIEVSNKCSIIPDMTKLDEKGYTTKSNGHGYGLSLLKEIVDSNKNIVNERSINKDIFTQIIKIKK